MFCALRNIVPVRRHIINTISPSTSQQLLCAQSQWLPSTVRAFTNSTDRFKMVMKELQEMGFGPSKYQFILAVCALSSTRKCTWLKKTNVYKKWGWSDKDILAAFRRSPYCMKLSEDKIDAIMEILVDKLVCPPSTIPQYAVVLSLSTDKRIIPLSAVLQVLLSKGLVRKKSLLSMFVFTERQFLKRCIFFYEEDEGWELLKLYQAKLDLAR